MATTGSETTTRIPSCAPVTSRCDSCGRVLNADPARNVVAYSGLVPHIKTHCYHATCWRYGAAAEGR